VREERNGKPSAMQFEVVLCGDSRFEVCDPAISINHARVRIMPFFINKI
jgi:hypothetical protein